MIFEIEVLRSQSELPGVPIGQVMGSEEYRGNRVN